ncbi:hypothetical protein PGB90_007390 [Kerria lacca]
MKNGVHEKVGKAKYFWFINKREKGLFISGSMLKEKALQYYEDLKDTKKCTSRGKIYSE